MPDAIGGDVVATICKRCRASLPRTHDRLLLEFDVTTSKPDLEVELCRGCARDLEAWLDPPESVRAGWADRRLGRQA